MRRQGAPAGRRMTWPDLSLAILLVALAVVPLWSSPASSYGFEPDKTWLLLLLLPLALGAHLAGVGRLAWSRRDPVGLAPFLPLAAALLSALFARQPAWAWYGSPQRAGGLFVLLALACAFWLTRAGLRQPVGAARISKAILLGSAPVLVAALFQRSEWPLPAPWASESFAGRLSATLGNPDFLASYLTLVLPLTLLMAIETMRGADRGRRVGPAIGLALLAVLQSLALFWTRSRAGWLGAAGGLLLLALLTALRSASRRRIVTWLQTGCALALLILLLGVAPLMLTTGAGIQGPTLDATLDSTGSGRQRLTLWGEIVHYFGSGRAPAGRWLVGFGPDAGGLVLPNEVAFRTLPAGERAAPAQVFDRAHNVVLDALLTTGALGLLAGLALGLAAWRAGLRRMGWSPSWRTLVIALVAGVAAQLGLSALVAVGLGRPALALQILPAALGLGIGLGLCASLFWEHRRQSPAGGMPSALHAAALAGLFGHWIEMQFSFETPAAGLLIWVYLAVLLGTPAQEEHADADGRGHARIEAKDREWVGRPRSGAWLPLLSGCILASAVLAAQLGRPPLPAIFLIALWASLGVLGVLWGGQRSLYSYPLLSLGPALAVWGAARLLERAPAYPLLATVVGWVVLLACAGSLAWLLARAEKRQFSPAGPLRWARLAAGFLLGMIGCILALRLAAGDILTAQGLRLAEGGDLAGAARQSQNALIWGFHDSPPLDAQGQIALLQARQATEATQREDAFGQAAGALRAAWDASPYQTEYGRRLALVYEEWAEAMPQKAGRRAHLEEARAVLARAQQLAPADARLRADLSHITTLLTESQ